MDPSAPAAHVQALPGLAPHGNHNAVSTPICLRSIIG